MKKRIVAFILLSAILLLAGCGQSSGGGITIGPEAKFESQVKNNEYSEALSTYYDKISGNASLEIKAEDFLEEYLSSSWADYKDEKISKREFDAVLQTIQRINDRLNCLGWTLTDIQNEYPVIAGSKQAYQEGTARLKNGDYEQAMESFLQVAYEDSKNYDSAQEQYEEARSLYIKGVTDSAKASAEKGNYEDALEVIYIAEWSVGYQTEFEELKKSITTQMYESQIRSYADKNDFPNMYSVFNTALNDPYCSMSSEVTELVATQKTAYRKDVISRSVTAYKSGGYQAAIPVISEGLAVLPDDEQLLKYEELYNTCAPMSLVDLAKNHIDADGSWNYRQKSVKDTYGNTYSEYMYLTKNNNDKPSFISINLDRKYTSLTAHCFVISDYSDRSIGLRIYGDGVVLFDSGLMTKLDDAKDVSLDVTNVRVLRVEGYGGKSYTYVYLADGFVTRTLTDSDLGA